MGVLEDLPEVKLKLATSSQMFDTKFGVPGDADVVMSRWEENYTRYGVNYAVLFGGVLLFSGWWKGVCIVGPLVLAHSTFKTRTIASKVSNFFKKNM